METNLNTECIKFTDVQNHHMAHLRLCVLMHRNEDVKEELIRTESEITHYSSIHSLESFPFSNAV